jgi:hypothetical protein
MQIIEIELKQCPRCEESLPLSEFGICRARKDGLNLYCKRCVRLAMQKCRARHKPVARKSNFKAQPMYKTKREGRVLIAFRRGLTDRQEIVRATRLRWDEVVDQIAQLNDVGEIKWNRQRRIFEAA